MLKPLPSHHRAAHWILLVLTQGLVKEDTLDYRASLSLSLSASFLFVETKHLTDTMKWKKDSLVHDERGYVQL